MCGIVGAVAQRDVTPVLIAGLKRLEYRGYDSAGVAVITSERKLERRRVAGKVAGLEQELAAAPVSGGTGIAHTRWATHGRPVVANAHPLAYRDEIALVHNGIIENHEALRRAQMEKGYTFTSETDTETIVNQVHIFLSQRRQLLDAVFDTLDLLEGAYALGIVSVHEPERIIAARHGSPLVIGIGTGEHFLASDVLALLPVTRKYIVLADGDVAEIKADAITIYNDRRQRVERPISISNAPVDASDKGGFRHYMLKEIFEQPSAIRATLEGNIREGRVADSSFGAGAAALLDQTQSLKIVACGTSYHAGLIAQHWAEGIAGIPCTVEIASEFRYRRHAVTPGTLCVAISQSGETADTLAAVRLARKLGYLGTLAICNVRDSSLTREVDTVFLTRAGAEIGVASTKAFITQLVALLLLILALGRRRGMSRTEEQRIITELENLPGLVNAVLSLDETLGTLARQFRHTQHALYLGRGSLLPVAMEGALKLKEISYIHAEAYAAGELKHGPLALVDENMPVIALATSNELLEKVKSNLQEVKARGGKLYVFTDSRSGLEPGTDMEAVKIAHVDEIIAPIIFTVPLQLFAYYIAALKGADIDQPRNLAKSVTVE